MENQLIDRLQRAIDYIEDHLLEKIQLEDIAKESYMSLASFYQVFHLLFGTTVKDYIRKRRLTLSAKDLVDTHLSILNIALKYQYESYEAYSRAFKKLIGNTPTEYRKGHSYTNFFPRVTLKQPRSTGGTIMINHEMNKDTVLKALQLLSEGYIFDVDIDHFDDVNKNYGYSTGDKVLIEVPRRIKEVLVQHGLSDEVTRIGNDEFVVILKNASDDFVKEISHAFLESMKKPFAFDTASFSLSVSIGVSKFSINSGEVDIIENVQEAMLQAKRNGRNRVEIGNA